ncbi:ribosome maturation protein [Podospora appendiculata]|uniref:Ribosome maturation protein n=1 Tax=Podospora appendiculata TaxID=314037 RepID=A0AAE0XJX5_9PEZI|nr:ribosome maturation protein [Podospora appendiculata]
MTRGGTIQTKVHFKGTDDDFLVFLDSVEDYKKWLGDKSIPLAQVVSSFKIFVTHKHGAQGTYDAASKAALENEFGTSVDDKVIEQILEKGTLQESQAAERQGSKNDSNGAMGN